MKTTSQVIGEMSATARGAQRVKDIFAALAPPPAPIGDTTAMTVASVPAGHPTLARAIGPIVPGVAGGAVGAFMWKKHRVLGFLAGHAVGANALGIVRGGVERRDALCQLGVEGAGVIGALKFRRHPVFGWVLGVAAGTIATSFVPGSVESDIVKDARRWLMKRG